MCIRVCRDRTLTTQSKVHLGVAACNLSCHIHWISTRTCKDIFKWHILLIYPLISFLLVKLLKSIILSYPWYSYISICLSFAILLFIIWSVHILLVYPDLSFDIPFIYPFITSHILHDYPHLFMCLSTRSIIVVCLYPYRSMLFIFHISLVHPFASAHLWIR